MSTEKKRLFTASEGMKQEYCAEIVRIGEMKPIENSDFLVQTMVDGFSIVVSKGEFTEGEPVIYCMNETALNKQFLSVNNQFELGECELNANAKEVFELLDKGENDEAKKKVGFFNKHGRVKLIKLRGCPSYGCIFKKETLAKWNKKVANENLEDYLTVDENGVEHPFMFDTVGNELFAEAYVPPIQYPSGGSSSRREKRRNKGLKKVQRVIPGEFVFHFDTQQLKSNMWKFKPDMNVTVSVKEHGTSFIGANVLTRIPNQLTSIDKWWNRKIQRKVRKLEKVKKQLNPYKYGKTVEKQIDRLNCHRIEEFRIGYGPVYSSRTVIRNPYSARPVSNGGYYGSDIWSEYGELLKPYIDKGMTVYGEICGYLTGSEKMIQKNYDYGCNRGENFIMPYRITWKHEDGTKSEWNVMEVFGWTLNLIKEHPELANRVKPITVLYHGTLGDLYPDVPNDEHWGNNILNLLSNDVEHFGMEKNEPLCKNKVPREGICIRIDDDVVAECFKLKTFAFLKKEQAEIDAGNVDVEMSMAYGEGGN